jgi:hypothetical protein
MKGEYFHREDWTAQISMNLLGNLHFWRSRFFGLAAACEHQHPDSLA